MSTEAIPQPRVPVLLRRLLGTLACLIPLGLQAADPNVDQFTIEVGDTVTDGRINGVAAAGAGRIETPGAQDHYRLTVAAGQAVYFDKQQDNPTLRWRLRQPNGDLLFDGHMCVASLCGDPGTHRLADAGEYTLEVYSTGDGTGPYGFQVWAVPAPQVFPVQVGDQVTAGKINDRVVEGAGYIETPGAQDHYRFTVATSRLLYFDKQRDNPALWWRLRKPNGDLAFEGSMCDASICGDPGTHRLADPGEYTVEVYSTRDGTGPYGFQVWAVPAPQVFPVQVGDQVTAGKINDRVVEGAGFIETPGAQDHYRFTVATSRLLYFDKQRDNPTLWWRLRKPNGDLLFERSMCDASICGDLGAFTLADPGDYILEVYSARDGTGPYGFQVWAVPAPQVFPVQVGDQVTAGKINDRVVEGAGYIETPGAQDHYRLTVAAGQAVYFDKQQDNPTLWWRLRQPNGDLLFDGHMCVASLCGDPGTHRLADAGEYTLEVYSTGDGTGPYGFQVWAVPAPQVFPLRLGDEVREGKINGQPTEGAGYIETPGAQDHYRLTVAAGQAVYFDKQRDNPALWWRVRKPDGDLLFDRHMCVASLCGDPGTHRLADAGEYTLEVYSTGDGTGPYGFQVWAMPAPEVFPLRLGDEVREGKINGQPTEGAGYIETPGAQDHYRLTVAAGQAVYFDKQQDNPTLWWRLRQPNGDLLFERSMCNPSICGDPGAFTLADPGDYILEVYSARDGTGPYGFQIWPVPAEIVTGPADQVVAVGNTALFAVQARYATALGYQWRFNGSPLPGQTAAELWIHDVRPEHAGEYTVEVTSQDGSIMSRPARLTVLTNPPCAVAPAGLIGWWTGNDTPNDVVGTNHAVLMNGATFGPGRVGQAFSFDGIDDWIEIADSPALSVSTGITVAAWVRLEALSSWADIAAQSGEGQAGWELGIGPQGHLRFGTFPDYQAHGVVKETAVPAFGVGRFVHVAATFDTANHQMRLYVDGWPAETRTIWEDPPFERIYDSTIPIDVGYGLPGAVDELLLFDRALSAGEIATLYAAGGSGLCAGSGLPLIREEPRDLAVLWGDTARFHVGVQSLAPPSYQWRFKGEALADGTTGTLVLPDVQPAQAGGYDVIVSNPSGSVTSRVATLTVVTEIPDLTVAALSAPASAVAGQPVAVSWISTNRGNASVHAPWTERLLLANNREGTNAEALVTFEAQAALDAHAAIDRRVTVILPRRRSGPHWFVVETDAAGQVAEGYGETNNRVVASPPLEIGAPDLLIEAVRTPPQAVLGAPLEVAWQVRNAGTAPARSPWYDRLILRSEAHSALALRLDDVPAPATLAPGQDYTNHTMVLLPLRPDLPPGPYRLEALADAGDAEGESNEANNRGTSSPFDLVLPALPDLAIARVEARATLDGGLLAEAQPGQTVSLTWLTTNRGPAAVRGVWREQATLSVDGQPGTAFPLANFTFTNDLPAGASLARTQAVSIPLDCAVGTLRFGVVTDPANEVFEGDEANNATLAARPFEVRALLTLSFAAPQVIEGQKLTGTVTRNGPRTEPLTVQLTSSDPSELRTTNLTVVIPSGQASAAFVLEGVAGDGVDGPQPVTLTARAPGFPDATRTLTVLDADVPSLALTPTPARIGEGFALTVTVTRDWVAPSELVVLLATSNPRQLAVPGEVRIPAGQTGIQFQVIAAEDTLVESPKAYTLTASATGFNPASALVTVDDNDLPQVTLTVREPAVSEGAGPQATIATVTQQPVSLRPLRVELASADTNAILVPLQITIPAGQPSVSFPVAAVNNEAVDGPRSVALTGFILESGGRTRLAEIVPASLTVLDDDGPTLKLRLARELVAEGLDPATTAMVTRNTIPEGDLVVRLETDDPSEASTPATVTIPAGQAGVSFPVSTLADGATDGSQRVTVTATALGFTTGTAVLTVTDMNRPDLVIASVAAPPSADTDTFVPLTYRVENQGLAPAGTNILTRLFLSRDPVIGEDLLVGDYRFNGTIPAGQYFEQTLSVPLKYAVGSYWVVAQVDVEGSVDEILEDNNTTIAVAPLEVVAAYRAVVETDLELAPAGTPVPLRGRAFRAQNQPAPEGALVSIHIAVRGTHRVISAQVDDRGQFTTLWQPLPGEGGYYEIGATHPDDPTPVFQDSFFLLGLRAEPGQPHLTVMVGGNAVANLEIENLADLPLTGVSAAVLDRPANVTARLSLSGNGTVPALGRVSLVLTVRAENASLLEGTVLVRLSSAEGAVLDLPVPITVKPLVPRLVPYPAELELGMVRGAQRVIEFALVNEGGAPSGPLSVSLPAVSWMSLASANPLDSLAPGGTNRIIIVLSPPADLPLGPYTGQFAINGTNSSLRVPFVFRALSEAKGDLVVRAVDEYTYYAEGEPPLAGASVVVRDPVSRQVVASGTTDLEGRFHVPGLLEAYYDLEVSAEKHNSYRRTHLLLAGQNNDILAFLPRQTVQYRWTVEPTEIEDRYKITIETIFEAFVPIPLITIEPNVIDLAALTADVTQIDLKVTNHGLIAANDFQFHFDQDPCYTFQPLADNLGSIPAKSSLLIPLVVRRLPCPPPLRTRDAGDHPGRGVGLMDGGGRGALPCFIGASACWTLTCGEEKRRYCTGIQIVNLPDRRCQGSGVPSNCPDCEGGSGGSGGGTIVVPPSYPTGKICDLCYIMAIGSCVSPSATALLNCFPGGENDPAGGATPSCAWATSPEHCLALSLPCIAEALPSADDSESESDSGWDCLWGAFKCICPQDFGTPEFMACLQEVWDRFSDLFAAWAAAPRHSRNGAGDVRSAGGAIVAMSPFEVYVVRLYPVLRLMQTVSHDPDGDWFQRGHHSKFLAWWKLFTASMQPGGPEEVLISNSERAGLLELERPPGITAEDVNVCVDRWNRTVTYWRQGITNAATLPPGLDNRFISLDEVRALIELIQLAVQVSQREGFADPVTAFQEMLVAGARNTGDGVCAQVRVQLEQEAVLSRDAFAARIEIENRVPSPIEGVALDIAVTDLDGRDKRDLFQVRPPDLAGLSAVDGSGQVAGNSTGRVRWLLVPTPDAAPEGPVQYWVGGTFQYTQEGTRVSIPLTPAPITVYPQPRLEMQYFHQRDVFSDDPFTEDIIEPSIPYSLAVMVRNRGGGVARNFRIASGQPRIIENEKGLLVDFRVIASEVAGQNAVPSLTAAFGNIEPGRIAIARWLLTSTLQGLFVDYDATFEHLDALGNERLSLIDSVSIHEMNRLVQAPRPFEDDRPDFLVNEVPDLDDLPDTLYLSDGSTNVVLCVTNAVLSGAIGPANLTVQLSAAMPGGWAYLRVPDPGQGEYKLKRVVRSDGETLARGTNVWTTDRTFRGFGTKPVREAVLHLFDYNSPGIYTLEYEAPAPPAGPPSSQVAALPSDSYAEIPLTWSGQDGGAGIAYFDIYVSVDDEPFRPWLERTRLTGAVFPGEVGKRYAFYSLATGNDGQRESPPATPDAVTTVSRVNHAPVLAEVAPARLPEGQTWVFDVPASDPDGDRLTFSLVGSAPAGLALDADQGRLTWVTGEAAGPGTHTVTVQALDNGRPRLGATRSYAVTVDEVNQPPILEPIANQAVSEGRWLLLTNVAYDLDLPWQRLTYAVEAPAPAGVQIDAVTGVLRWRPTEFQGGTTNRITVVVTDDGSSPQSARQSFEVIVRDTLSDFSLGLGTTNLAPGATAAVPIALRSGAELHTLAFLVTASPARLANLRVEPLLPGLSLESQPRGAAALEVQLTAPPGSPLVGALEVARLVFTADTAPHSARVILDLPAIEATTVGGETLGNARAIPGTVFVAGAEPILVPAIQPGAAARLVFFGQPGHVYRIDMTTDIVLGPWVPIATVTLETERGEVILPPTVDPHAFFRVIDLGTALAAPEVEEAPQDQTAVEGGAVAFTVRAKGTPPLRYQWRRNGGNLAGATNALLLINPVTLADGGRYTVAVWNDYGVIESGPAVLRLGLPPLELVDDFADRRTFTDPTRAGTTNNANATPQAGEPTRHAGKRGGKSLWMTWVPPQSGVATFRTVGSAFDTLLAVYTGAALETLVEEASDEDRGGSLTSALRFNAVAGRAYHVVVDGFARASGDIVLSWGLEVAVPPLPRIIEHPRTQLVAVDQPALLTVATDTAGASYQWLRNGRPLPGATSATLSIARAGAADVGTYRARVTAPNGQAVESRDATLEVVDRLVPGDSPTADKLADLFDAGVGGRAGPGLQTADLARGPSQGIPGWRWLNNLEGTRSADDPDVCQVITSATRWLRLPRTDSVGWDVQVNTADSDIPAVVAVFEYTPEPTPTLRLLACDVANSNRPVAEVWFEARAGLDYVVMVDGAGGARGTIELSLDTVGSFELPPGSRLMGGRLFMRFFVPPGTYALDAAPRLRGDWRTVFRTNVQSGLFEYHDPEPANAPARFFRLLPQPGYFTLGR